ncbi:MAG: hypothetical protein K6G64_05250 [Eubacterium sp.]|nr:hypothetical protein [Eubacterium sp.]
MKTKFLLLVVGLLICFGSSITVNAMSEKYYQQLNSDQKKIYNEMLNHFYGADSTEFYSDINRTFTGIPMDIAIEPYKNNALIAYSALLNDYPDFYWATQISLSFTGGNLMSESEVKSSTIYKVLYYLNVDSTVTKQEVYEKNLLKAIRAINKKTKKKKSDYQRILAIHKYICKNTKYDIKHVGNTAAKYHYLHTAYGVFVKKKAVCDGYSIAFKELCDYYKIPCMIVYGRVKNKYGVYENHAWNVVKLKKKWYAVDSTWDDSSKSKTWFLCGRKQLKKTHMEITANADVLQKGVFSYPKINKKSYK